ncbi:MAG: hypothetical protein IPI91_19415 [Flavobacteriales bacterium]|nr:hypothetical protein [Flavobacteriales bacterium]
MRRAYTDNCRLRDSITVLKPDDFVASLPADTTLCEGDTLVLDVAFASWPHLPLAGQFQGIVFVVRNPGKYRVELALTGCTTADS